MKQCTVCKEIKSLTEFYNSRIYKDGKQYRCKSCDNLARKNYEAKNLDSMRRSRRLAKVKWVYGLTEKEYDELVEKHSGKCAICGDTQFHLSVDHCHKTGKIRGLLCPNCNRGLGIFKDSITRLSNAIKYLEGNK